MKKLTLAAAAAILTLCACATLTEGNTDAKLLTQYAVIKVAGNDPGKADRIEEIATDVRQYTSGEEYLTVDLLVKAIELRVDWNSLDAADTLLVRALLERLRTELVERYGTDVLPADLRLAADTVAGWVIEAAQLI